MAKFVLTFRNSQDHTPSEAEGSAWMKWFEEIGPSIVDPGSQVGATSTLGNGPAGSVVSGYTVVSASDLESAVTLAKGCPGLAHSGAVEVGELISMG